jgi:sigma-B regulation protein RsbU (phosphoserine phosphatase)
VTEEELVERSDEAFYGALVDDDAADLYDNAPCAYLSTLPDGTIVKANGTFLTWTGYERSDLIGTRRFQELLAPGDRIFHETHYAPALRMQGQVREIAVEIIGRSGDRLPVLLNSVLKRTPEGDPVVVRTAIFDATERRAYERELVEARQRAEESEARARTLAQTLQASFLPHEIPTVPGLDIAGAYRPAGDGGEVGGDFYDVFATGDDRWGIVLGDVCGKGARAAVLTSLARYTVRAESLRTTDPAVILGRVHDAFLRDHPDQFCTAVVLLLDGTPARRVRCSSGGHEPPLRFRIDGTVDKIGRTGTLLGLLDERPALPVDEAILEPGDVLVVCTDGVAEGRRGRQFFGDDRLRRVVVDAISAGRDAAGIADALVTASVEFQAGVPRDDIAIVVVRVPVD